MAFDGKHKYVLFGASSCARDALKKQLLGLPVAYFCDNDKNKWGEFFPSQDGPIPIYPPEILLSEDLNHTHIIITSGFVTEIAAQLNNMGIREYYSWQHHYDRNLIDAHREQIEAVCALLEDEASKTLYKQIIEFRRAGKADFSQFNKGVQYFKDDIFTLTDSEVFVDAGAYRGETIEAFLGFCGGRYKKIHAFEPEKDNYEAIINKNFDCEKIIIYPYAVYDCETELRFNSNMYGSAINDDGSMTIQTACIDNIKDDITFIKMDVEGAEMKALYGARKTIEKHRPKLAICLYHNIEDFWNIPLLLSEWAPYRFHIHHHSNTYLETVLYASARDDNPQSPQFI